MTRKEEIKEAAELKTLLMFGELDDFQDRIDEFIESAKWADKTMIEKACKWLKENIDLVAMDTVNARSGYHEIVMMNDFERKFREAMEE